MQRIIGAGRRELWAGIITVLVGLGTIVEASSYNVGNLARMGPGYFPVVLGVLLVFLGALIPFTAPEEEIAEDEDPTAPVVTRASRLRGMACIVAGVLAFMFFGLYGGLAPATFALVFISALGDTSNTPKSALILALGVTVFGMIVFSWALQLQFPMFRWG